jgi:hypothetical protein
MTAFSRNRTPTLLEARFEECRREARGILKKLMIEAPAEIDLAAVAGILGGLTIEEGGIEGAEGRILWGERGAAIRVKAGLWPGRKRFTLAHEIGHFVLHRQNRQGRFDTGHQLAIWNEANEEAEANVFASELLMPDYLFTPRLKRQSPSFRNLDGLAEEFQASRLSTALQYVHYCHEQVAIVFSRNGAVVWSKASKQFPWRIRHGQLSKDSGAGALAAGNPNETGRMAPTPVYAWLSDFEYDKDHDIMEESRAVPSYDGGILSLLWAKEDMED